MKKLTVFVLLFAVLFSVCACVKTPVEQPTVPPTEPWTEPPTEAPTQDRSSLADDELFEGEKLRLVSKTKSSFAIYCPDITHNDAAVALQNAIYRIAGAKLNISAAEPKKTDKVIIVGPSSLEDDKYTIDTDAMGTDGFVIKVFDGCIVLRGNTPGASLEAVYTLVNDYFGFDALRDSSFTRRSAISVPKSLDKTVYRCYSDGQAYLGQIPLSDFVIRVSNSATDDIRACAEYLSSAILSVTGTKIRILSDVISPNDYENEILVGQTRRESSCGFNIDRTGFKDGQYIIKTTDRSILISGMDDSSTRAAVYAFAEEYLGIYTAGFKSVAGGGKTLTIPADVDRSSVSSFNVRFSTEFNYAEVMENNLTFRGTTPCFSDESFVSSAIKAYLASANGSVLRCIFNAYTTPCTCENCKKAAMEEGTDYGSYYRFVNRLAAELKAQNPDAVLEILAYKNTFAPPATKLEDNVSVILCDRHLCSGHAINDETCPTNAVFMQSFEKWKKVAKHITVLDFTSDYYYYPVTFPNWNVLYDNIRFYADSGVEGVMFKIEGYSDLESILEFRGLREYLIKQMIKNTSVSKEMYSYYIDRYLDAAFGWRGHYVRQYMDSFAAKTAGKCYTVYTKPSEILSLKKGGGATVEEKYDLDLAKEFYDIWAKASPYSDAVVRNGTDLAKMIYRYFCELDKSENVKHAKVQFNEWLLANLDMFDSTEVINYLIGLIGE